MRKGPLRYEGKAKRVYETDDPSLLIMEYKDDATAFNGEKRGTIEGKGAVNNHMSNVLMRVLADMGVPTHFVSELGERETLVRAVEIVPLEVIVRNAAAGSFATRYGVPEGVAFLEPTIEFSYKNDALGDPLINASHVRALGLATASEIDRMKKLALLIDNILVGFWEGRGVRLVDFKVEFGRTSDGQIILADEISPDTCRLWDAATGAHLDKDRFRRDLGDVREGYAEALRRLELADSDRSQERS